MAFPLFTTWPPNCHAPRGTKGHENSQAIFKVTLGMSRARKLKRSESGGVGACKPW